MWHALGDSARRQIISFYLDAGCPRYEKSSFICGFDWMTISVSKLFYEVWSAEVKHSVTCMICEKLGSMPVHHRCFAIRVLAHIGQNDGEVLKVIEAQLLAHGFGSSVVLQAAIKAFVRLVPPLQGLQFIRSGTLLETLVRLEGDHDSITRAAAHDAVSHFVPDHCLADLVRFCVNSDRVPFRDNQHEGAIYALVKFAHHTLSPLLLERLNSTKCSTKRPCHCCTPCVAAVRAMPLLLPGDALLGGTLMWTLSSDHWRIREATVAVLTQMINAPCYNHVKDSTGYTCVKNFPALWHLLSRDPVNNVRQATLEWLLQVHRVKGWETSGGLYSLNDICSAVMSFLSDDDEDIGCKAAEACVELSWDGALTYCVVRQLRRLRLASKGHAISSVAMAFHIGVCRSLEECLNQVLTEETVDECVVWRCASWLYGSAEIDDAPIRSTITWQKDHSIAKLIGFALRFSKRLVPPFVRPAHTNFMIVGLCVLEGMAGIVGRLEEGQKLLASRGVTES